MTQTFNGAARTIAGRRYVLAFRFAALCELHKAHPGIMGGLLSQERLTDPNEVRNIVRLGLERQVRTDDQVADLITLLRVRGALEWIGEALSVAFGAVEGEPVNRPTAQPQPLSGTGPKSWLSGLSWVAILMRFGVKRPDHGAPSSRADPPP